MKMREITVAHSAANSLGEGPIWHSERQSIFWVDILGKLLFEMNHETHAVKSWEMPERIGTVAVETQETVIVALQGGIFRFHLENEVLELLVELEKDISENRPNDGKCDVNGRLWQGTMDLGCAENAGSLYCFDSKNLVKKLPNLSISNGMVWSLDNQRFYLIDSTLMRIDAYFFDEKTGEITFEKTVVTVPETMGLPDGMTIDTEGMLWVAHWGGFAVRRWNPATGELMETIEMPVPQVTSCAFGGEDLDELFITTARTGMSTEALAKYPESGHLFKVKTTTRGIETYKFGTHNAKKV